MDRSPRSACSTSPLRRWNKYPPVSSWGSILARGPVLMAAASGCGHMANCSCTRLYRLYYMGSFHLEPPMPIGAVCGVVAEHCCIQVSFEAFPTQAMLYTIGWFGSNATPTPFSYCRGRTRGKKSPAAHRSISTVASGASTLTRHSMIAVSRQRTYVNPAG